MNILDQLQTRKKECYLFAAHHLLNGKEKGFAYPRIAEETEKY
jgi:hypothetical protein